MGMGVVDDSEFEKDVINSNAHVPSAVISDIIKSGRRPGDMNVPDALRKIIGETSELDSVKDAVDLASHFGISRSSVSAYAQGATSTKTYDETPNKKYLNEAKSRVAVRARKRLMSALKHITDDKMQDAKVGELAVVAKSMAGIIKDMEPTPEMERTQNAPQFVIYAPQVRTESHYETIYAKE